MHRGFSSLIVSCFVFVCLSLTSSPAWAGKVVKVKGKKVYIKLSKSEVGSVEKGDKVYLTTKSGKKKGIVKIRKIKGRKALAKLSRGKAKKGYRTRVKKSKPKPDTNDYAATSEAGNVISEDSQSSRPDMLFGLLGGYGIASQDVVQTAGTSSQSGSSIAVKGLIDYSVFDDIGIRIQAGIEMFSVSGPGNLNDNASTPGTLATDITYLSLDALLRWYLLDLGGMRLYISPGIGILSPLSNETSALKEDTISTSSIIILGGGIALPIGKMELFGGADYYIFPASENVKTSVISLKAGLLFDF